MKMAKQTNRWLVLAKRHLFIHGKSFCLLCSLFVEKHAERMHGSEEVAKPNETILP